MRVTPALAEWARRMNSSSMSVCAAATYAPIEDLCKLPIRRISQRKNPQEPTVKVTTPHQDEA